MSQRALAAFVLALATLAWAAQSPILRGVVEDASGRPLAGASVRLLDARGHVLAAAVTGAAGRFHLPLSPQARRLRISRPGFLGQTRALEPGAAAVSVRLALATLRQTILVAATGTPVPRAQLGMAASLITRAELQAAQPLTLADALRVAPGLGLVVSGQVGALTTPAMRGGEPQFIKILLDGIPLQRFDFGSYILSNLLPGDLERIEIVRGPDSVIHGSAAASGVIDLHSRTGAGVPGPEMDAEGLGGAYGTYQQNEQVLGSWKSGDYAFDLPGRWRLRAVARRIFSASGEPGTIDFYGLADNSFERQGETYQRYTLGRQMTPAWSSRIAVGQSIVGYFFDTPAATGIPVATPFGPATVGLPVLIRGANGFSVSGQALLDIGGAFPSITTFHTARRDLDWQSAVTLSPAWSFVGGYRYDNENGVGSFQAPLSRHDNGIFAHLGGGFGERFFASVGASEDWNTPFGRSFNSQGALAWLVRPSGGGWLGATRLRASAGTALEDPNLFQQASSLDLILLGAGQEDLIAAFHVQPMRPQRARSGDFGLDQFFAGQALRLSVTGFDARYYDLVEFVPPNGLLSLGVAPSVAQEVGNTFGGADVNSLSVAAKGAEVALEAATGPLRLGAAYTLQDARVLRSLSSDALFPSFNPAFPNIPIGAFAPLAGARPFRVPPGTFSAHMAWHAARGTLAATYWWESRRDDSTFLSDVNFGPTLLLPNHDLDPAFARLNLSGFVPLGRGVALEAVVENVLNDRAVEVIGFPAPGVTARVGLRLAWPLARR